MDDADLDLLLALANEGEEHSEPRKQDAPNSGPRAEHPLSASRTPIPQHTGTTGADPARSRSLPRFTSATTIFAAPHAPAQSTPRTQQPKRQISDGYLDSVSGFRVSKPVIGSLVLKERLTDDGVYISLKDISPSRELSGRWATMGVLTSKVQATGRDGSPYSRWTLSDLAGKQVTLFLWRKAASEHYKELEGSLLLLWSPQVRRDEGGSSGGGTGFSLNIDKPEMLQRPGMSADFGLCRGIRKDGQRCTLPINKSTCEYCPYHAQAALRALSSNRSDMAGANLLQRQLLPQARAAQKNIAATTGKPMGGINSLLARPPPPKLLQHVMGGGRGSGMSAGRPGSGTAEVAGTGAYGVIVDREGSSGHVAAAAGSGGSKRSYGVQLLANLQERSGAGDEGTGGPPPKRCKSSTDTWNDGLPMSAPPSISAAKTRAISAALAAGKMVKQLGGPTTSARTTPLAATAAAVTAADSATAAARVPRVATRPRFAMPPPLAPHLASLLKPPTAYVGSNSISAGGSEIPILPPAVPPSQAERRVTGVGNGGREIRHSGSHFGDSAAPDQASGGGSGDSRSSGPGTSDGTEVGLEEHPEELLLIDLESEDQEADVRGGSTAAMAGVDGDMAEEKDDNDDRKLRRLATDLVAPFERTCNSDAEIDEKLEAGYNRETTCTLVTEQQQQQQQQRRNGEGYEAKPSSGGRSRSGRRGLAESGGTDGDCGVAVALALNGGGSRSGDVCSLEKLLDVFPGLQDAEEKPSGEVLEAAKDGGERRSGISGGGGGVAAAGKCGKASERGADSTVVRAGTGTPAAVVTGLLPRVRGLLAPPAARAVEARKQQAAAVKARSEKLKSIGLKVAAVSAAAVVTAQPKPLHAANMGGSRPFTVNTTEAAVALAVAKGLPMPRASACAAATQAAASAAPSSALAAAFGSLVQQLPSAAVESRYNELSEEAAGEAVLSMLEGLEARDALVKQLDSITHLKVTAWHCAQCNRLSEFMDKQCRSEGHNLSKATTLKRFWTCNHCNARITTLGMRFPANRCSRCNNPSLEFTACTMYRGPRELKPAGMAAAAGLASKENLFATIEQHPEIGCRTFR